VTSGKTTVEFTLGMQAGFWQSAGGGAVASGDDHDAKTDCATITSTDFEGGSANERNTMNKTRSELREAEQGPMTKSSRFSPRATDFAIIILFLAIIVSAQFIPALVEVLASIGLLTMFVSSIRRGG